MHDDDDDNGVAALLVELGIAHGSSLVLVLWLSNRLVVEGRVGVWLFLEW